MRYSLLLLLFIISCTSKKTELKTGTWRGVILIQGEELPFNFSINQDATGKYSTVIHNASEQLLLDEVSFLGDSVNMVMHIFDAYLRASLRGDSLVGVFNLNYDPGYKLPFKAAFGQSHRFVATDKQKPSTDFSGTYDVQFFNETNTVNAVGIFKQEGNYAEGSFITPTGDYRYLEGNVADDTLYLSAFDGNHVYIFKATRSSDSTITGKHWLGKSRNRMWSGKKNNNPTMPDPTSLTYLKEGYEKIEFSFPDLDGNKISPTDDQFKNKVLVLQLFGTWCPNCMDETRFLAKWYRDNKGRGVEILGLSYERKDDFSYASERVKKMKEKLKVDYDFVIAGTNDNAKAAESLPMLNKIAGFPTTIFIGKDGSVKHIHTGFSGPGTGIYYEQNIERFNQIINELLSED